MTEALAFESPIEEHLIYFAKALAPGHPVFMLNGYGDDRLVIKAESGSKATDENIKFTAKILGAIDRVAKPKVLTPTELSALKSWAWMFYGSSDKGATELNRQLINSEQIIAQGQSCVWVKMRTFKLMTLDDANKKMGTGDKTDVRYIAKILNRKDQLEFLGRIVAADLFNNNGDRFHPEGGIKDYATLVNAGNVFIAVDPDQKKSRPLGLDGFDPNGDTRINTAPDASWLGKYLRSDQAARRSQYARGIIADLNRLLGPRKRRTIFGSRQRLDDDAATRLATGMDQGITDIKFRLRQYYLKHGTRVSQGISARVGMAGWTLP